MDKFTSYEQYKSIVRGIKARYENILTNCFLMGKDISSYIEENRLLFQANQNGVLIYVDEGSFYELYYYWNSTEDFPFLKTEKDVSVVEINNRGQRDTQIASIEKKLLNCGFSYLKTSRVWTLNVLDSWNNTESRYEDLSTRIFSDELKFLEPIPTDKANAVLALWEQELDLTDIPHSHRQFSSDHTACIMGKNGVIASAYWWKTSRISAEGRHIVTNPLFMRRGLGSFLLLSCVRDLVAHDIPYLTTYISDSNMRSIQLHKSVGFLPTDKTSKQFILKGGEI